MSLLSVFKDQASFKGLVFSVFAIGLMIVDSKTLWLKPTRLWIGYVSESFYFIANVPRKVFDYVQDVSLTNSELHAENRQLKERIFIYQAKVQKLDALANENTQLRKLLNSSAIIEDKVLVSEIIGVDTNDVVQRIIINQGAEQGVFVGQAVLDSNGVLGQVIEVMPNSARVLLISDALHAIPVMVSRNGLRGVVAGTGNPNYMDLLYVATDADIKVGDVLVSSGLAKRFPADYPVAEVVEVKTISNQIFAQIIVKPKALLNQSRYVLLVLAH